jgi:hypothetical protein
MTSFGCTTGGAPDTFTRLKSKPQRLSVSSWDKSGGGGGSGVASAVATPDDAVVCVVSSANGRDRINSGCTSLAGGSGVDAALVWGGAISLMGFFLMYWRDRANITSKYCFLFPLVDTLFAFHHFHYLKNFWHLYKDIFFRGFERIVAEV